MLLTPLLWNADLLVICGSSYAAIVASFIRRILSCRLEMLLTPLLWNVDLLVIGGSSYAAIVASFIRRVLS